MGERKQGTLSGGLVVEDNRGRLIVVHNRFENKWGVPAGGLEGEDLSLTDLLKGEFEQETGLNSDYLSVGEYERKNPLVVGVVNETSFKVGQVFRASFKGWNLPRDWEVVNDKSVDRAMVIGPRKLKEIIRRGEVYKPEFNIPVFEWWLGSCRNRAEMVEIPNLYDSEVEWMKRKGRGMWVEKK